MLKQVLLCSVLITAGTIVALRAQQLGQKPTIDYTLVFTEAESRKGAVDPAVLAAITTWLSENFDLPPTDHPRVQLVPPVRIAAFRYRGFAQSGAAGDDRAMLDAERDTLAVYDETTRTIYLREGWRGETPAEVSILVHEMVHHLQSRGQIKFECLQEREAIAYTAQDRWLGKYQQSLESEFGLDPFTRLVRTRCMG